MKKKKLIPMSFDEYAGFVQFLILQAGGNLDDERIPGLTQQYWNAQYDAMGCARQIMQDITDGAYLKEIER